MLPAMSVSASPPARPWVADDIDQMPDDGYRREVIGGVLLVSPSPVMRHQRCVLRLAKILDQACPPALEVMISPCDWRPETRECFVPDLMVIRSEDFEPDGPLRATPALVVEVLSPSNPEIDRAFKRMAYERLGVPAYWIVDASAPGLVALELNDKGRYVEVARASGKRHFTVHCPYPVELVPANLVD
jgi:Uma2 family endonuclease